MRTLFMQNFKENTDTKPAPSEVRQPVKPVIPLPNPGEGGPVYPGVTEDGGGDGNMGQIPTPDMSWPPASDNSPSQPEPEDNPPVRPVIPLPNPGEGGPVYSGPDNWSIPGIIGTIITSFPRPNEPCRFCNGPSQNHGNVRFMNTAAGYNPFRVYVNDRLFVSPLGFGEVSSYDKVSTGYQIVTVMGDNQYIYIQKPIQIQSDSALTVIICNTESGLDLYVVPDVACGGENYTSCLRVCNLSPVSGALTVVLGNNAADFSGVEYQELTDYKTAMPGDYVFYCLNSRSSMLFSSSIALKANVSYTIYLFNWNQSADAVTAMIVEERNPRK